MKTKRLVVDLPERLHAKFTRAINRAGLKKKKVVEEMVDYWTENAEARPHYFKLLKQRK